MKNQKLHYRKDQGVVIFKPGTCGRNFFEQLQFVLAPKASGKKFWNPNINFKKFLYPFHNLKIVFSLLTTLKNNNNNNNKQTNKQTKPATTTTLNSKVFQSYV